MLQIPIKPNQPPKILYPESVDLSSSPDSAFNKIWDIKQCFLKKRESLGPESLLILYNMEDKRNGRSRIDPIKIASSRQ